jgi:iron(III) transport system ATP-binding protein
MADYLEIQDVAFSYADGTKVCEHLSFTVSEGEIGCLLGPSGCGKTTLMRLIAGFETPRAGEIRLQRTILANADFALTPEKRGVGVVFRITHYFRIYRLQKILNSLCAHIHLHNENSV